MKPSLVFLTFLLLFVSGRQNFVTAQVDSLAIKVSGVVTEMTAYQAKLSAYRASRDSMQSALETSARKVAAEKRQIDTLVIKIDVLLTLFIEKFKKEENLELKSYLDQLTFVSKNLKTDLKKRLRIYEMISNSVPDFIGPDESKTKELTALSAKSKNENARYECVHLAKESLENQLNGLLKLTDEYFPKHIRNSIMIRWAKILKTNGVLTSVSVCVIIGASISLLWGGWCFFFDEN